MPIRAAMPTGAGPQGEQVVVMVGDPDSPVEPYGDEQTHHVPDKYEQEAPVEE